VYSLGHLISKHSDFSIDGNVIGIFGYTPRRYVVREFFDIRKVSGG
jgi:hypothetical protein